MVLFRLFVKGLWVSLGLLILLVIADSLIPGKLAATVFSPMGILSIFITYVLIVIWALSPTDVKGASK